MALINIDLGSTERAKEALHKALQFEDLELHELQQLADILMHLAGADDMIDDALSSLDDLICRYPGMASPLMLKKSELYARFDQMEPAFQLMSDLHNGGYTDQKLLNNLATVHQIRGDLDAALGVFDEGYKKFPGNETLFRNYLSLLMETGQFPRARALIEHSLFVEQPGMKYLRAMALAEEGALDQARRELEALVEKHPGSRRSGSASTEGERGPGELELQSTERLNGPSQAK